VDNGHDLELLIKSRIPLIEIASHEEQRALHLLRGVCCRLGKPIFKWTITEGLQRLDRPYAAQRYNAKPTDVLGHIKAARQPGVYVLIDFHPYLDEPKHVRLLKDIALAYDQAERTIVLHSHAMELPGELRRLSARFELAMPDQPELQKLVRHVATEWARQHGGRRVRADRQAFELLVQNLSGLTITDAQRLARNVIYDDGAITSSDVPVVMQAKYQLLQKGGVLSFAYDTAQFSDIGGMHRLKRWLEQRQAAFKDRQGLHDLDAPKGILLLGVQGCGKSLAAKAAAGVFGVPLLRLDFGSLFNKYYGETERNLREALKTAEVMAPCVLWMDEIEKGLAPQDTNSGTSRRVLGTLLTWMAEKTKPVFMVATANDISSLPPELVRKGRFDEIFFVDLPTQNTRSVIWTVHLQRRHLSPERFELHQLAAASDGFSGSEIEQAVVSALYAAHAQDQDLTTAHLLEEIKQTRPLSVVMAEQIQGLRAWAATRTVPSD
jgi:AAA+ superfamily predicted ATPase